MLITPPSTLTKAEWPPNYVNVFAWRQRQLRAINANHALAIGAKAFYAAHPVDFINHWIDTYDPRRAGSGIPARMPFVMFERQSEMIRCLLECLETEQPALIEKSRDMGATWLCCAFSVWLWLFRPGTAIGWGSRKQDLVDRIGVPDSIFEKMRMIVRGLPGVFWPRGLSPDDHMTFMKFINPENGATITGEAGDNIGRGGRNQIYFKDEAAYYERPEKIEAALGDNTRCQIDISSVNGLGNVFHRRRESGIEWSPGCDMPRGKTRVFVLDWRDHPEKTEAWFQERRAASVESGLLHVFAQEVERNYSAAVENVIIPAEWVRAAIDAHVKLGFDDSGGWCAALDVADGGGDRNALARRKGAVLKSVEEWGERDTGMTTRRAIDACKGDVPMQLQYDSIGVGAGVKSESNRLGDGGLLPNGMRLVQWNAAAAVLDPDSRIEPRDRDSPINKDFYANLKAQAWWQLRRRFERTYRAVNEKIEFDPSTLISLPSALPALRQIEKELSQATSCMSASMKLIVNKTPEGTKSPNMADAIVMAFWPVRDQTAPTRNIHFNIMGR